MVIDNLTSTDVYIEKKQLIKIICDKTTNSNGLLEIDALNNPLITMIDSGDTPLYRLSEYSGNKKVMLYNPTTKQLRLLGNGEFIDINIDFIKGTQYFLEAERIKSTNVNKNIFNINLNGNNIFKIFLDGTELTRYDIDRENNTITILGIEKNLLDDFSQIVCWTYKSNTIPASSNDKFVIEYYNYQTIWDQESFHDGTYFESFKGEELNTFDSLSINQSITKTNYKNNFNNSYRNIINSVENTIDINIFNISDKVTMTQYVGNEEFRMILNNPLYGRVVLINNCRLDNGVSLSFEKEKNLERLSIPCGNYIDIQISDPSIYGKGKYGKGQYGSGAWIYNSARREV